MKNNNGSALPDASNKSDFDVEDIRKLREVNSQRHLRMTHDEIIAETREHTAEIIESLVRENRSESGVRVISTNDIGNGDQAKQNSSKGKLSVYADPVRQSAEEGAWEQAAAEKHTEPYYRLKLDDPATPGFISSDKDYYGTMRELLVFAERLEAANSYPETANAIPQYGSCFFTLCIIRIYDVFKWSQRILFKHLCGEDEDGIGISPMEIVSALQDMKPFPQPVWDFIIELLELEIENGSSDAMNDLGAMYYDGTGCEQSFEKAVYYYKMAAAHGNRQAQENLGYCYYYGRNMPVDYEKAFHYFALGAFDGHLISLYKIGDMYMNGYYVEKNETEAFIIYERCMETMTDEAAQYVAGPVFLRLGQAFLYGKGTQINLQNSLICFQKAETYLYDMVKEGQVMYKKSLFAAVEGQKKARDALMKELPQEEWTFD